MTDSYRRQPARLAGALLALLSSGCSSNGAAPLTFSPVSATAALPKVEFPTSAVHELPSMDGRRYQVWVDLPASYGTSPKPLPVVFVTDPNWAFPVVRSVRNLTGQRGRNIEDFILVGLTHDPALTGAESRARDYTPTDPRRSADHNPADYDFATYGQAKTYLEYIETRVFPLIASSYRADMTRTTFIGHSYGGLFGAYVMLTRPQLFDNYILGSPSLWFDRYAIFDLAERSDRRNDTSVKVHMVTGSYEIVAPGPRSNKEHDLVADMRRFEQSLAGRADARLTATSETAQGEDHLTAFPDVASRGLVRLLPGYGPYTGG